MTKKETKGGRPCAKKSNPEQAWLCMTVLAFARMYVFDVRRFENNGRVLRKISKNMKEFVGAEKMTSCHENKS